MISSFDNVPLEKLTPAFIESIRKIDPEEADYLEQKVKNKPLSKIEEVLKTFITEDPFMLIMKDQIKKIAPLDDPVIILGETGTGKEIIANALHGDRKGNFVPINCAGLQESLIESELFGHKKGAFTGAATDKKGLCEEAKDGTIFLDEIGELPMSMQAKLLRAIQENKIRRVGETEERTIQCRFVAATHRDLESWVKFDKFRADLYWRISTFPIKPKALRDRKKDIPLIVRYLVGNKLNEDQIKMLCASIDPYKLDGNVRSLQQIIKRYLVLGVVPHEFA